MKKLLDKLEEGQAFHLGTVFAEKEDRNQAIEYIKNNLSDKWVVIPKKGKYGYLVTLRSKGIHKELPRVSSSLRWRKDVNLRLIKLIRFFHSRNGKVARLDLFNFMKKEKINAGSLPRLNEILASHDASFKIESHRTSDFLFTGNTATCLILLSDNYKKMTGEELDNSKYLGSPRKLEVISAPEIIIDDTNHRWKKWCLISAVLSINPDGLAGFDTISAFIRKYRAEEIGIAHMKELIKSINREIPDSIEVAAYGAAKIKKEKELIRAFHPKEMKRTILVRLQMTPEQLERRIGGLRFTAETSFSEYDHIYSIDIDRSYKTERILISLYLSMRGPEKFLREEELLERLEKLISLDRKNFEALKEVSSILRVEA